LPVAVQVDDDVESTVQRKMLVDAEVRVDPELAAAHALMQSSAAEVRIGEETVDSRESFEELEERGGVELIEKPQRRWADALLAAGLQLLLVVILVLLPHPAVR